jgi:hypothetical protein
MLRVFYSFLAVNVSQTIDKYALFHPRGQKAIYDPESLGTFSCLYPTHWKSQAAIGFRLSTEKYSPLIKMRSIKLAPLLDYQYCQRSHSLCFVRNVPENIRLT